MDNRHYVNGVKEKGELVMPKLDHKTKKFLNDFNREYYNASFRSKWDYSDIHEIKVDRDTILDIKSQIKVIKASRKRIFDKSPNTTTQDDRDMAAFFTSQIDDLEEFLNEVHPRRACEHANNNRNNDFLTMVKANNEFDLVSWETLNDDDLVEVDLDYFKLEIDDD